MTHADSFTDLERAITWLETERTYVSAELDGFRTLRNRVANIDPEEPHASLESPVSLRTAVQSNESRSSRLTQIVTAFEETVMATPHYEAEYGDDVLQNFAVECTPSLATLAAQDAVLTPPVYDRVTTELAESITSRKRYLELLETEQESLSELRTELGSVREHLDAVTDCPAEKWTTAALQIATEELATDIETCERLAATRQRTVQDCRSRIERAGQDIEYESYMYPDTTAAYPGLAAISIVTDRTRDTRARFRTELASRGVPTTVPDDAARYAVR